MNNNEMIKSIAAEFQWDKPIEYVDMCGNGLINDTYLVGSAKSRFIIQRLNIGVFKNPWAVANNMQAVLMHMQQRQLEIAEKADMQNFKIPNLILTKNHEMLVCDDRGDYWRAMTFIENAVSLDVLSEPSQAWQVGKALGYFQYMLSNFNSKLHDTLPGFHQAPLYLQAYDQCDLGQNELSDPAYLFCRHNIEENREFFFRLENAKKCGDLQENVIHGDPKANNFLFDQRGQLVISLVDLDTIKPGLIHYDIGDCVRSACNLAGEGKDGVIRASIDLTYCEQLLNGYLSIARWFFRELDYIYLFDAIRLLALELGLRFFTDFLMGNKYFKTRYASQNLHRAATQFYLAQDILEKNTQIAAIIDRCRESVGR